MSPVIALVSYCYSVMRLIEIETARMLAAVQPTGCCHVLVAYV